MKRAIFLTLGLAACSQSPRSVDWFAQHPHDAAAVADRCILSGRKSVECDNAQEAMRRASDARLKLYRKGF